MCGRGVGGEGRDASQAASGSEIKSKKFIASSIRVNLYRRENNYLHKFKAFSFTIEKIRHDQSFLFYGRKRRGGRGRERGLHKIYISVSKPSGG